MLLPVLGSTQTFLGSTQTLGQLKLFLGSTQPSETQKLGIQLSFTWVDPTFPWVDSRFSWVDSTSSWVDPNRVSREPFLSSVLSCLWVDPHRVWVDSSLGRLNFILGRPSQYFQRTIFLSLWQAWGLGRPMLFLGRPNLLFICAIFAEVCQMLSWCAGVDPINLGVDSIHTLLQLKVRFIQVNNEMHL